MTATDTSDPRGLIHESYQMDGITLAECRSIFLDWALSQPTGQDSPGVIEALLARYGADGHPMTTVLQEGLTAVKQPAKRRGGWKARATDKR